MTTLPAAPVAPAIRTREQLDALLENIAQLHRERDETWRAQENEINAVRQRYRAQLTEMNRLFDVETSWAEAWARANPAALDANRALESPHATIGFRAEPPKIERASRRWTWSRIALTLAGLPWGQRYLRIPEPVVDQDAFVADFGKLSVEDLRHAGIIVVQGERFFLEPKENRDPSDSAHSPDSVNFFPSSTVCRAA